MTTPFPEDDTRPCLDKSELFDSDTVADHLEARKLCAGCPFVDDCLDWYEKTRAKAMESRDHYYGPSGTWAGRLIDEHGHWIRICLDCETPIHAHANIQRCKPHAKRHRLNLAAQRRSAKREGNPAA